MAGQGLEGKEAKLGMDERDAINQSWARNGAKRDAINRRLYW